MPQDMNVNPGFLVFAILLPVHSVHLKNYAHYV